MLALAIALALSLQSTPQSIEVPGNLLVDPHVDAGGSAWQSNGDARVERIDGNLCLVVRNRGLFQQSVPLQVPPAGTHVVLLARASGERINPDGAITGLPSLYALVTTGEGVRILAHLQAHSMLSAAKRKDEWTTLWGVFEVPEGATSIVVQLSLAERGGVPQNGSAGRFDDLALVLVASRAEALALAEQYR